MTLIEARALVEAGYMPLSVYIEMANEMKQGKATVNVYSGAKQEPISHKVSLAEANITTSAS